MHCSNSLGQSVMALNMYRMWMKSKLSGRYAHSRSTSSISNCRLGGTLKECQKVGMYSSSETYMSGCMGLKSTPMTYGRLLYDGQWFSMSTNLGRRMQISYKRCQHATTRISRHYHEPNSIAQIPSEIRQLNRTSLFRCVVTYQFRFLYQEPSKAHY